MLSSDDDLKYRSFIGVCRTPMSSIRSSYAYPKFGKQFWRIYVTQKRRHKNDVTCMETGVCRQHYYMNNRLILLFKDINECNDPSLDNCDPAPQSV